MKGEIHAPYDSTEARVYFAHVFVSVPAPALDGVRLNASLG